MYILKLLPLLLMFAPSMALVLLGIRGVRVHVNAITAVSLYTLAWGLLYLILSVVYGAEGGRLLPISLLIAACAAVGGTLMASKRNFRLAKLSGVIAAAATLILPLMLEM